MEFSNLEYILKQLGADEVSHSGDNYVKCNCVHAPYTSEHKSNFDSKPSMYLFIPKDKGYVKYGCFTCNNKGTLQQLIQTIGKESNTDVSHLLAMANDNLQLPDWKSYNNQINKPKELIFTRTIIEPIERFKDIKDYKLGLNYLKSRNINTIAINKCELKWDNYEKRIVIPVLGLDYELYGYTSRSVLPEKYFPTYKSLLNHSWDFKNELAEDKRYEPFYLSDRNTKIKIHYEKNRDYKGLKKKQCILGMHLWEKDKPLFIVEGLFGYLHLISIGADEIFNIGATMGANLSDHQAKLLIDYKKPCYILFDNDKAGEKALFGDLKTKGAIDKLENKIPLLLPKWPKLIDSELITLLNKMFDSSDDNIDGYIYKNNDWYKSDPDKLTIEDLKIMKVKAEIY